MKKISEGVKGVIIQEISIEKNALITTIVVNLSFVKYKCIGMSTTLLQEGKYGLGTLRTG